MHERGKVEPVLENWHRLMPWAHLLNVLTLWSAIGDTLQHTYGYRDTIRFLRETWSHRYSRTRFSRRTSFIVPQLRPNLRAFPISIRRQPFQTKRLNVQRPCAMWMVSLPMIDPALC